MGVRYDMYGNQYRVAKVDKGESLVWAQVFDDDGEVYNGELCIVDESALHDTPPRQKLDSQIAELQQERKNLFAQVAVLRQELTDFERGADNRMVKLKQHKALRRLDDFLAGRITHYVESGYGPPKIVTFEDAKTKDSYDNRNKLKLLSLFGCTNGDLEWGLNLYNDGSGIYKTVVPCVSHTEAVRIVQKLCAEHEKKVADSTGRTVPEQRWVDCAVECGFEISPNYLRDLKSRSDTAKQKNIEDLELKLQELRKV